MKLNLITRLTKVYKSKLMNQFLITYSVLIIIPLIILFTYTYTKMSSIIKNNIITSTEQAFDQSSSFIDYKLNRILNSTNSLAENYYLTSILKKNPNIYPLNEQISDLNKLHTLLSSYTDDVDITSIHIYVNSNFIYSRENADIFSIKQLDNSKLLYKMTKLHENSIWCPSYYFNHLSPGFLSLSKPILSPDSYSTRLGYIVSNFRQSDLENILKKNNLINGSVSCIINSDGDLIASSNKNAYKKYKNIIEKSILSSNPKLHSLTYNHDTFFTQNINIDNTDWTIVNIVPYTIVLSKINNQRIMLIIIVLLFGSISLGVGFCFFNNINRRLNKVIKSMREVNSEFLNNYIKDDSDDELGELIINYNRMISKIAVLVDEQYKLGKAVKNAELKSLQSQINPHFLYNTLDMINWMAYKNMNTEISTAVKKLANFYKLSLSKGKDVISIEDELNHVSLYVGIQNMRYSNRISLEIDVEDFIKSCSIPKITLQPIIENAITHGIFAKGNVEGNITITGLLDNNYVYLKVSDDGIGIKESDLASILSPNTANNSSHHKGSGYGIKNVNDRLKLHYGEDCGLSFHSIYEKGTTVTIKLPIEKETL